MRGLLCAGALALAALGCGGDDDPPQLHDAPLYEVSYVPGCEGFDYAFCDIREFECQTRLLDLAVCVRQDQPATLPPISFFTEQQLSDFWAMQYPEPLPDPNHYEDALELLNLATDGALGLDSTQTAAHATAGFYRYAEDDVFVILRDIEPDSPDAMEILLHEFLHGLQDREFDLPSYHELYSNDYDSFLAANCLIEGEARFHQLRVAAALNGLDPNSVDFTKAMVEFRKNSDEWLIEQDSIYTETYDTFPYVYGAVLVEQAFVAAGQTGISALFAAPPVHTQHVMADNWGGARFEGASPDFQRPRLAPTEVLVSTNVLGAWGAYMVLIKSGVADADARLLSLEWRGDELAVYGNESTFDTSVLWQIELGTAASVASFTAALRPRFANAVRFSETRVLIGLSTGPFPERLFDLGP